MKKGSILWSLGQPNQSHQPNQISLGNLISKHCLFGKHFYWFEFVISFGLFFIMLLAPSKMASQGFGRAMMD
ncbi:hypothetical protein, partial [Escherichia coli]|uniref:hypothetical protein n=1 Tax=Escherichia coli TaxID=562 RepID=UPI00215B08D9